MKLPKLLKRLNVAPLLRGSRWRSQNHVAGEEVVTLNQPNSPAEVIEGPQTTSMEKSSIKSKPKFGAFKVPMPKMSGLKTVAKKLFGFNHRHPRWSRKRSTALSTARSTTLSSPLSPRCPPSTPVTPAVTIVTDAPVISIPVPVPVDLSPLATGMQLNGSKPTSNPDDFVIRAFNPGAFNPGTHQACTPHPLTGTMLVRPRSAPASTSPCFREITMNDVRDELHTIFAQLPASKASPTKNATKMVKETNVCVDSPELPNSTVKKALMMTPTSDAAVQTDLINDIIQANSPLHTALPTDNNPDSVDDGKDLYAWGHTGFTLRLSSAVAAKIGMRCVVSEGAPIPEPVVKQQANNPVAVTPASQAIEDEKITVAWGTRGHTMRLSKAAAAKLGMKVIVPSTASTTVPSEEGFSTPVRSSNTVMKSPLKTPLSGAFTVGPKPTARSPTVISARSPTVTPSNPVQKKTPTVRYSTFDAASIMLKLANNGVTPPPSTARAERKKNFDELSLAEMVSMPLCELYPEFYGPDNQLWPKYRDLPIKH